jgi:arylsulfatase A-like enzyme
MEHGGTEHAKTLYQELVRVPLAVRLPGARRAGTREAAPVQQIDLHPTLLRFAGAPPQDGLPGRDLAARWLGGAAPAPREPLLFADQRFTVVAKTAARQGRYKLILNADGRGLWRTGARLELYDLLRDPAERANLVASRPIAARRLELELERFRKAQAARRRGRELTLSAREREQLRALGYVQ